MLIEAVISRLVNCQSEAKNSLFPSRDLEEKVRSLFTEMLACEDLRKENVVILSLKGKITKDPIADLIDKAMMCCMRNAADDQVKEYLGLNAWEEYAEAEDEYGEKEIGKKALNTFSTRVIKCFKERTLTLDLSRLGVNCLPPSIFKHCSHITKLDCCGNKLIEIPKEIKQLVYLQSLNCNNNCLTEIPVELTECENLTYFQCEGNQLTSLPGNLINKFGLVSQNYQILEQFKSNARAWEFRSLTLENFSGDIHYFNNICLWLQALLLENEFRDVKYKRHYSYVVLSLLDFAERNKEFQDILRGSLDLGYGTCQDRASLMFNNLQVRKEIIEKAAGSIEEYLKHLKGSYALDVLENVARGLVTKYRNTSEELEIFLALQIHLKEAFKLPIIKNRMAHYDFSKLTLEDLEYAKKSVREELKNLEKLRVFLINNEIWVEKLKETYPQELEAYVKNIMDQQASLDQVNLIEQNEWDRIRINNIIFFVKNTPKGFKEAHKKDFEELNAFQGNKYIVDEEHRLVSNLLKEMYLAKEQEWIDKKTKELLNPPKKRLASPISFQKPKKLWFQY